MDLRFAREDLTVILLLNGMCVDCSWSYAHSLLLNSHCKRPSVQYKRTCPNGTSSGSAYTTAYFHLVFFAIA